MANNFNGYPYQFSNSAQFLPSQPIGFAYSINNSSEINSIPITNYNATIFVCLPESTIYIRTLQNSLPIIKAYKMTQKLESEPNNKAEVDFSKKLEEFDQRFQRPEPSQPRGGSFDELL